MLRSFRSVREEETKSMIRYINDSSSSSSSVLNLSEMFVRLTNDVVCRVALGRKYNDGDGGESGRMFKKLLGDLTDLLGTVNIGDYIPWLSWLSHINGLGAKLDKVAKQLDDFIDTAVQEHMNHSSKSGDDDQKDFLDVLLAIQKENLAGIPIDKDMFAAGTDTTYTALEWAMTELLRHFRVMNKLQNEVRGIVGNKRDMITEDDLVEMHYLKAVTKETLRFHPPLPLLFPRMSIRDVEVNGYNIKANTHVFINAWQIGRDPKLYNKPEEYEPERFLNNGIDYKGNDFELIPFGAGRRVCPGIQFAMAVNEIALANIVHKFDWALPDEASGEDLDMTETTGLTAHKKYPLVLLPRYYSTIRTVKILCVNANVTEIALVNIVHKFDWKLPGGATNKDLDVTEATGLTMHRKYPLKSVVVSVNANVLNWFLGKYFVFWEFD
ncbi:PREDICTED: cytochrome P450 71A24-like [Prunus mume]|uniref:Cytochrome P450 71A24-like n=1 Tax=Prunus mume TaxID=102107 RepID=A0ABM1LUJ8_PRUMU|nr:PREDICTED: cytochrome P450 71A24-like [Prunus mume]